MISLRWPFSGLILLIASLLPCGSPCWATTFAPRPFEATLQGAPNFVRGFVGQSRVDSAVDSYGTKRVYTYYALELSEVFKSTPQIKAGGVIQFREFGGLKDGRGVEKSGAAHFEPGEDVVVTLGPKNPDGSYDLLGMSSGKYLIKKDENGADYLVGGFDDEGANDATGGGESQGPKHWTLDAVRGLVKAQASSAVAAPKSGQKVVPGPQNATLTPSPASMGASVTVSGSQGTTGSVAKGLIWGIAFGLVMLARYFWSSRAKK